MDTAQAYTQGNSQAANRGPIANLPLPNLSGQANGVIGKSQIQDGPSSLEEEEEDDDEEALLLERIAAQSPPSGAIFDWGLRTGRAKRANVAAQVISSRDRSVPTAS